MLTNCSSKHCTCKAQEPALIHLLESTTGLMRYIVISKEECITWCRCLLSQTPKTPFHCMYFISDLRNMHSVYEHASWVCSLDVWGYAASCIHLIKPSVSNCKAHTITLAPTEQAWSVTDNSLCHHSLTSDTHVHVESYTMAGSKCPNQMV